MPAVTTHLRFALRRLRKRPFFSAVAVASLALGIGANTAMFSLVNAVLLRDLPLRAPEELYHVYLSTPDFEYGVFSYPDYRDFRDATGEVWSDVGGTRLLPVQIDRGGSIESVIGEAVTGNYFPMLGVEAAVGRTLTPEDDLQPRAHPVVMLGHDYWRRAFAGDPGVVGQELRLGSRLYTVVGVVDEGYSGSLRALAPAVYVPMMMIDDLQPTTSSLLEARGAHSIFVQARLRPGVPLARAEAVAGAVAAELGQRDLPSWDPDSAFLLIPQDEVILFPAFDKVVRSASRLLMGVVGLVLLLACTNLASFLLAQSLDRRKEVAVRLAMGARRRSLVGQMVTETVLLGALGGIAGIALATALLRVLTTADLPLPLPIDLDLSLDLRVLAFATALSLTAGALLGLIPALQNRLGDLASTLRSESAGGGQGGKLRLRGALVVVQVAISSMLLLAAGLFLRSMNAVQDVDPGFGAGPTALLSINLPMDRFGEDPEAAVRHAESLVDRFSELPGVSSVGLIDNLHLSPLNTQTFSFNVAGFEPPSGRESFTADRASVDGGFFDAAGVKLVAGRGFDSRDRGDAEAVAVVSEALAARFWPGAPDRALGGRLLTSSPDVPALTVIGVAADAKVRSLAEDPRLFVYRPMAQDFSSYLTVVARTGLPAEQTAAALLQAARCADPELFLWEAKTLERHLGTVLLPARLSALLLSAFAVLALALAVVGLYGLVAYGVSQRRREVGIRISLGADRRSVVALLMASGLRLVAVGAALGILGGAAVSRLVQGLLFGVEALDPVTFVVFPSILLVAGALAALIPALGAGRIEPAGVLRSE